MIKKYLTKVVALFTIAISIGEFNSIGVNAEWRQDTNGWWYAQGNSYDTGLQCINRNFYYFNSNGYMQTGWELIDEKWHYFNANGTEKIAEWLNYSGKQYFFDYYGVMQTGWITTNYVKDNNYYYFNEDGTLDNSKTTKIMPYEIKKAYDIISDYYELDDETKLIYYSTHKLNLPKEFQFSNSNAYSFEEIGIITDDEYCDFDNVYYEINSGKLCIINQGIYTLLDTKETFDSNKAKAKAIQTIRSSYDKFGFGNNGNSKYMNIKEEKDYYTIDCYEGDNGVLQSKGLYYLDKNTGEIKGK